MAKIKFVRNYLRGKTGMYDVVYESGRAYTFTGKTLPKTVDKWLYERRNDPEIQYDKLFKRTELIYRP